MKLIQGFKKFIDTIGEIKYCFQYDKYKLKGEKQFNSKDKFDLDNLGPLPEKRGAEVKLSSGEDSLCLYLKDLREE